MCNWAVQEWPQHSKETFQIYSLCCVRIAIQNSMFLFFFSIKISINPWKVTKWNNPPTLYCQDRCTVRFAAVQQQRIMYFLAQLWRDLVHPHHMGTTALTETPIMFFKHLVCPPPLLVKGIDCIPYSYSTASVPSHNTHLEKGQTTSGQCKCNWKTKQ